MSKFIRKTTHQMARELLALPDVPLEVEMWCAMDGHEMAADLTRYTEGESKRTAIIYQKPVRRECTA